MILVGLLLFHTEPLDNVLNAGGWECHRSDQDGENNLMSIVNHERIIQLSRLIIITLENI